MYREGAGALKAKWTNAGVFYRTNVDFPHLSGSRVEPPYTVRSRCTPEKRIPSLSLFFTFSTRGPKGTIFRAGKNAEEMRKNQE